MPIVLPGIPIVAITDGTVAAATRSFLREPQPSPAEPVVIVARNSPGARHRRPDYSEFIVPAHTLRQFPDLQLRSWMPDLNQVVFIFTKLKRFTIQTAFGRHPSPCWHLPTTT